MMCINLLIKFFGNPIVSSAFSACAVRSGGWTWHETRDKNGSKPIVDAHVKIVGFVLSAIIAERTERRVASNKNRLDGAWADGRGARVIPNTPQRLMLREMVYVFLITIFIFPPKQDIKNQISENEPLLDWIYFAQRRPSPLAPAFFRP